jgi:hypothetical protein
MSGVPELMILQLKALKQIIKISGFPLAISSRDMEQLSHDYFAP